MATRPTLMTLYCHERNACREASRAGRAMRMGRDFTRFEIEVAEDGVATVMMARPPVNAVDLVMYREMRDLFVDIDQIGPGVRAVVLTGAGKHFCAGNDLDDFATMNSENVRERMFHVREAFFAIQECAVPVVGAVGGRRAGTGLCLAAACDFVIASEDASSGCPSSASGVHGGARHLGRMVSQPWSGGCSSRASGCQAARCSLWAPSMAVVPRADLVVAAKTRRGGSPPTVLPPYAWARAGSTRSSTSTSGAATSWSRA